MNFKSIYKNKNLFIYTFYLILVFAITSNFIYPNEPSKDNEYNYASFFQENNKIIGNFSKKEWLTSGLFLVAPIVYRQFKSDGVAVAGVAGEDEWQRIKNIFNSFQSVGDWRVTTKALLKSLYLSDTTRFLVAYFLLPRLFNVTEKTTKSFRNWNNKSAAKNIFLEKEQKDKDFINIKKKLENIIDQEKYTAVFQNFNTKEEKIKYLSDLVKINNAFVVSKKILKNNKNNDENFKELIIPKLENISINQKLKNYLIQDKENFQKILSHIEILEGDIGGIENISNISDVYYDTLFFRRNANQETSTKEASIDQNKQNSWVEYEKYLKKESAFPYPYSSYVRAHMPEGTEPFFDDIKPTAI